MPPEDEATGKKNPDSFHLYGNIARGNLQTEEKVCGECPRNGTRPGRHSPHLTHALALASHLDRLRQAGAAFPYPDALPNSFSWMCLVASHEGRQRADEARNKRAEDKRKSEIAEEERRRAGGDAGNRAGRGRR